MTLGRVPAAQKFFTSPVDRAGLPGAEHGDYSERETPLPCSCVMRQTRKAHRPAGLLRGARRLSEEEMVEIAIGSQDDDNPLAPAEKFRRERNL